MTMKDILRRISERRAQLGISENALSIKAGLSRDGIRNWRRRTERGEEAAGATITALAGVAGALGVTETWLIHGIGNSPEKTVISVAGRVGAGAHVPLYDVSEDGGLFQVAEPPQLQRMRCARPIAAVEVEGDSMMPMYQPGDILFFIRATHEGVPDEDIGRPCIVEDAEGNAWVKQVKRGDEPGLFHLISLNPTSETRHNQRIKWAARVRLALPAEMVERL
ncbi:XRE family transcriptional regulator [Paracoccus kondratievae]|uniref:Transcriptional regulator n=1 Tax=Paracoccus kondratievae TaxID=135740 RepID=A0AAD3P155_9RHOB|nr:S24 family peptidase [Paracoccus kondratievae]GLK65667.1 transcriptional regulator [Paracoccus kondratievae]